ncbi:hypothetical protein ncot_15465 [Nocardioides sp. JQ2195]|uniref:SurA N-terminal domain-containing protein n=1 Tax=Nocardioides sp. JQ2195 TaxID=2592334 RepID=UPI00143E3EF3|nr:SurA N-terminal domain-containing protein [Nocardioides sp. JQ2195]QIX27832.1 hypothetical protein ncot_15465 [Nocardioides sp. JQ2195]
MKVRAVGAVAVGAVAVLALSGCGSDLGPDLHPGQAAVVGDHEISMSEVDSRADAYCTALLPGLAQSEIALPMSSIRDELVSVMVDENLARQYAEANDIDVSDVYEANLAQLDQQLNDPTSGVSEENRGAIRDFNRMVIYSSSVQSEVGGSLSRGQKKLPTDQELAKGKQEIETWAQANGVEVSVDPRFELSGDDSTALSFAVSDTTKLAEVARAEVGKAQPDPKKITAYTDTLPASQKCG